jgi:hypothetical protein
VRHRLRSAICIAVVALAGVVATGAGCSNQGEGERCTAIADDSNPATNGTQDCQDGLVCISAVNIQATGNYDRCCPATQAQATVEACMMGTLAGGNPTEGRDAAFVESGADAADAKSTPDGKEEDATEKDAKAGDAKTEDAEKTDADKDAGKGADGETDADKDSTADSSSD